MRQRQRETAPLVLCRRAQARTTTRLCRHQSNRSRHCHHRNHSTHQRNRPRRRCRSRVSQTTCWQQRMCSKHQQRHRSNLRQQQRRSSMCQQSRRSSTWQQQQPHCSSMRQQSRRSSICRKRCHNSTCPHWCHQADIISCDSKALLTRVRARPSAQAAQRFQRQSLCLRPRTRLLQFDPARRLRLLQQRLSHDPALRSTAMA